MATRIIQGALIVELAPGEHLDLYEPDGTTIAMRIEIDAVTGKGNIQIIGDLQNVTAIT